MTSTFANRFIQVAAAALAATMLVFGVGSNAALAAPNKLKATISIAAQEMAVSVDGRAVATWKVSTAGKGYRTPKGSYKPVRMHEMWYSRKYDNAPMPHSVFFHGGYAVHAMPHVKALGRPASHGCVRLHPDAAFDFFELVKIFGPANTDIVIVD
ncbi:MAG TPA: L,D-transpeptidase [Mesorhizobium sp.]|nr:L,D-transpeptidase [Mesorhizobium sp.]